MTPVPLLPVTGPTADGTTEQPLLSRRALGVGGLVLGAALTSGATVPVLAGGPTLKRGMKGTAVTTLQKRLNALRFWCGTPDGTFGHLTQQAVWALQKAAGLGRDGVVGPKTWAVLDRGIVPARRITSGTGIEIDKSRQLLICTSQGRLGWILNTSTGSGERYYSGGRWKTATTPSGDFRMFRFQQGWVTAALGRMYRPAYYDRGWAVHGSSSIPTYPASHGCARISTAASDHLWRLNWFVSGRRVLVY
ncbi:murein L,D-transpeptidase [Brachybacterium sp. EF45031]|uniref:L,D-transpeptidase family protein n=1 Tax=Brachybacterium sillae TaxID=2810536 RepID=UPI00217D6FA9|nr:L,D-transpeptidase family protein [Brachybacterium sillae]MCS6712078.1 murein L,D-transpeptidase [Brachybacterium sillae]